MKYTVIVNRISHYISTALLNYLMHDREDSVKHATTGPAPRPNLYKPLQAPTSPIQAPTSPIQAPYKPLTSPEIFVNSIS